MRDGENQTCEDPESPALEALVDPDPNRPPGWRCVYAPVATGAPEPSSVLSDGYRGVSNSRYAEYCM